MGEDLTIHEAAADPLIGQVLKADGVPQGAFAQLLQSAARLRANALERAIAGQDVHANRIDLGRNPANNGMRDDAAMSSDRTGNDLL